MRLAPIRRQFVHAKLARQLPPKHSVQSLILLRGDRNVLDPLPAHLAQGLKGIGVRNDIGVDRDVFRWQTDGGVREDGVHEDADVVLDVCDPHRRVRTAGLDHDVAAVAAGLAAILRVSTHPGSSAEGGGRTPPILEGQDQRTSSTGTNNVHMLLTNQPTHRNVVFLASSGRDALIVSAARSL